MWIGLTADVEQLTNTLAFGPVKKHMNKLDMDVSFYYRRLASRPTSLGIRGGGSRPLHARGYTLLRLPTGERLLSFNRSLITLSG